MPLTHRPHPRPATQYAALPPTSVAGTPVDTPIWGTWTGTLRWFLASLEGHYTFTAEDNGIVVLAGKHQGVGFASGDCVSFVIPAADTQPLTGTMTLLNDTTAHMVVGGPGVRFEGQLRKAPRLVHSA